eukprot:TRINITY_DN118066_c0_g1_i1.p1 TRINITY_DN118066_c0_g1~~TRINITY_DN118066_c0_g1_i1.p1  ORF type:complete len:134 (-),score=4.22 TRINITY_DN118066_c0_g1_i1:95-496(-)
MHRQSPKRVGYHRYPVGSKALKTSKLQNNESKRCACTPAKQGCTNSQTTVERDDNRLIYFHSPSLSMRRYNVRAASARRGTGGLCRMFLTQRSSTIPIPSPSLSSLRVQANWKLQCGRLQDVMVTTSQRTCSS